jgi:hypothetical protein
VPEGNLERRFCCGRCGRRADKAGIEPTPCAFIGKALHNTDGVGTLAAFLITKTLHENWSRPFGRFNEFLRIDSRLNSKIGFTERNR